MRAERANLHRAIPRRRPEDCGSLVVKRGVVKAGSRRDTAAVVGLCVCRDWEHAVRLGFNVVRVSGKPGFQVLHFAPYWVRALVDVSRIEIRWENSRTLKSMRVDWPRMAAWLRRSKVARKAFMFIVDTHEESQRQHVNSDRWYEGARSSAPQKWLYTNAWAKKFLLPAESR